MADIVTYADLPAGDLEGALPHFRRPFTAEAVRFKVQSVFKEAKGCVIVAYIDSRLVVERLNAVAGGAWEDDYKPTSSPNIMLCELTVMGRTRRDVGSTPKGLSKDLMSDALKRAAVKFGIGVSIYAIPEIVWWASQEVPGGFLESRSTQKGPTLVLTETGHRRLREAYAGWLLGAGERLYGAALDHGDVEGRTVAEEEEHGDAAVDAPVVSGGDPALVERVREAYAAARAAKTTSLKAGEFAQMLAAAGTDEQLRVLLADLGGS